MDKNLMKYFLIAVVIVVIDQVTKILVANYIVLGGPGEIKLIGDWLKIHYILNPGMAFGAKWGGAYGKLLLSLFRIVAIVGIVFFIKRFYEKGYGNGLLICMSLILGGAIGNGIDGTFYGVLLEGNAIKGAPTPWFHGQVVDMIYVDICDCYLPNWVPKFLGGGSYLNLWPIFNVADAAIFCSVGAILLFQKRLLAREEDSQNAENPEKQENIKEESGSETTSGEA